MGGFIMSSRRKFIKNTMFAGSLVALGGFQSFIEASTTQIRLTILHTNDMHCHLDPFPDTSPEYGGRGGMAKLAGLIEKFRKENPNLLLLDAGDMYQGTPYFNFYKGKLIFEIMSKMGYDAATIGNHEFDNGISGIADYLKYARFPLVNSNYDFTGTALDGKTLKYKTFNKKGIKIGIYGLGIEPRGLVSPLNFDGAKYLDPVETALRMEKILHHELKCDLIICLSHLGLQYEDDKISDLTLAPQTRYTDLIIGGHTHSFIDKPFELKNNSGNTILVNQAGWGTLMLGKIDFIFDRVKQQKFAVAETARL
jgi:5'-nucleotidase